MNPFWLVAGVMGLTVVLLGSEVGQRWWQANGHVYQLFVLVLLAVTVWLRRDWLKQNAPTFAAHARPLADIHCGKLLLLGLGWIAASIVWLAGALLFHSPPLLIILPFSLFLFIGILLVMFSAFVKLARMFMR